MRSLSRRALLRLAAVGAACLARPGFADEKHVPRLIEEASALPSIAERIAFISRALLGVPYIGHTLIGGPHRPELFVLREDGFDCVTFCETVLAAARARSPDDFASELRKIRYRDGEIDWFARNHYFAEWSLNNVIAGVCRPVVLPRAVHIRKTLTYMRELGDRRVDFAANPPASLFAHRDRLATSDIIGFVSRRAELDFFHTGFLVLGGDETLWLRHAAKSRERVLDQPFARFCAANEVRAVTLLRPLEVGVSDTIA